MLIRIVRNLTQKRLLKELRISNMSFEKFEELFLKGRLNTKFARAFFEWAELIDSYKGYLEEGTLDYAVEEVKELKLDQVATLTPKRMELLCQLATLRVESISDLAKKLRRNVKNVYQDLQVLRKMGFVKLSKKKGKAVIPETLVKEISFLIR